MGGVCSLGGTGRRKPEYQETSSGLTRWWVGTKSLNTQRNDESQLYSSNADEIDDGDDDDDKQMVEPRYDSGPLPFDISRELKPSAPASARTGVSKVTPVSSFIGKAGLVGLERAVDVLDSLGSSMSNLNPGSGFVHGISSRGNKISILAFEVANTIVKAANLMQSIAEEDIRFLKKDILHSEGVQLLVSTDMNELLSIAAADKREEFDALSKEVIRFGDQCKDPQWHNLGRFFSKFDSDYTTNKQPRKDAETSMQELTSLAEYTSELYHELHALDRFEQDYNRKLEEVKTLNLPRRGENIMMLHAELKQQRKVVSSLKRKSLWSKNLGEIVDKLVDIITYVNQEILNVFGENGMASNVKGEFTESPPRLGQAGLALHYANIVNKICNIASRPASLPPNVRDALYNGLPASVKLALRSRLQTVDAEEQLTIAVIRAEIEKTLEWLVPVATDTTKAHQGFGWVGEWANTSNDGKKTGTNGNLIRLQTLYHANKQTMDLYILELVVWLHRLISIARHRDHCFNSSLSIQYPSDKRMVLHSSIQRFPSLNYSNRTHSLQFSQEDRKLLDGVRFRTLVPGISKSQDFAIPERTKIYTLRSAGNSPIRRNSRATPDSDDTKINFFDLMLDGTLKTF